MKKTDLMKKWEILNNSRTNVQRVDPSHPLDFFIGITLDGKEEIVLYSNEEPQMPKSSAEIKVEKNKRNDGRWALVLTSLFTENNDLFSQLCVDLIENSRSCSDEKEGLATVIKRFIAWQKLFQSKNDCLSKEVLKGMVGELLFAEKAVKNGYSWNDILNSWEGPDGADRDFGMKDFWVESKAISFSKDKLSISSLNQLDVSTEGYLVVQRIENARKDTPNAFSVSDFINGIRIQLELYPVSLTLFESKLVSLGYIDKQEYRDIFFTLGSADVFKVDDAFPRLTPANVDRAIVGAEYSISLAGIEKWKVEEESIWK